MLGVRQPHQTRTNENEVSKAQNLGRVGKVTSSPAPLSPLGGGGGSKKRGLVDVTNRGKVNDNNKWPQVLKGSAVFPPVQNSHPVPETGIKVYSEAIEEAGEPERPAGRLGDEEDALVEARLRQADFGLSNRVRIMKGSVQTFFSLDSSNSNGKQTKRMDTRMEKIRDLSE